MRVVSRQELLQLPAGTLYHAWQPCWFDGLCIKGESMPLREGYPGDWWVVHVPTPDTDVTVDGLVQLDEGKPVAVDLETASRDGLFDDKLRYAVWERADVEKLVARLSCCLGNDGARVLRMERRCGNCYREHPDDCVKFGPYCHRCGGSIELC